MKANSALITPTEEDFHLLYMTIMPMTFDAKEHVNIQLTSWIANYKCSYCESHVCGRNL